MIDNFFHLEFYYFFLSYFKVFFKWLQIDNDKKKKIFHWNYFNKFIIIKLIIKKILYFFLIKIKKINFLE